MRTPSNYEVFFGDSFCVDGKKFVDSIDSFNSLSNIWKNKEEYSIFREMYEKMVCSTEGFYFESPEKAYQNFAMRLKTIQVMKKMNPESNEYDAGYWNPVEGIDPQIGITKFDKSTSKWVVGSEWTPNEYTPSCWTFRQNGKSAYDSMSPDSLFPFRGECMGALQIAILSGAASALGKDAFDKLHPKGDIYIGLINLATPAISKHWEEVDDTCTIIPGDRVFMINFDYRDVIKKFEPEERKKYFWGGENAIYYGLDQNMVARFGGLGLDNKSEAEMRATLVKVYEDQKMRAEGGKLSTDPIIQQKQVVFINGRRLVTGD